MITKEFFDRTIPDTHMMWELASEIIGVDLANGYRSAVAWRVHAGLAWLAKATEQARERNQLWPWAYGLLFKPGNLTGMDWPVGATCWYVMVRGDGSQWLACAETQHLAVLRAIVLMHALALDRNAAPHLRHKSIHETIQRIVAEFVADKSR